MLESNHVITIHQFLQLMEPTQYVVSPLFYQGFSLISLLQDYEGITTSKHVQCSCVRENSPHSILFTSVLAICQGTSYMSKSGNKLLPIALSLTPKPTQFQWQAESCHPLTFLSSFCLVVSPGTFCYCTCHNRWCKLCNSLMKPTVTAIIGVFTMWETSLTHIIRIYGNAQIYKLYIDRS